MAWEATSATQKKSLTQHYAMGCDCRVQSHPLLRANFDFIFCVVNPNSYDLYLVFRLLAAHPSRAPSAGRRSACGWTGWSRGQLTDSRLNTLLASRGAMTLVPGTEGQRHPKGNSLTSQTRNSTITNESEDVEMYWVQNRTKKNHKALSVFSPIKEATRHKSSVCVVKKKRWKCCYVQAVFCNPKSKALPHKPLFPLLNKGIFIPFPIQCYCFVLALIFSDFLSKQRIYLHSGFTFCFISSHSPYNFTGTAELFHLTISMFASYLNNPKQTRMHFECNCHSCRFVFKWNGWEGGLNPLFCIFYTSSLLFVML